jgi:hypothetical protein
LSGFSSTDAISLPLGEIQRDAMHRCGRTHNTERATTLRESILLFARQATVNVRSLKSMQRLDPPDFGETKSS